MRSRAVSATTTSRPPGTCRAYNHGQLSTDARKFAQIDVAAMDRNGQIGHVEAHPFRPWQADQTTLLPPSPREWLAEEHQVYFLLGLVEELHPSEILVPDHAKDPRGEEGVAPR